MTKSANHWHLLKKIIIKKNCWTLTYQNTWLNWVLADHLTSLANPCVVSRAFTSPFFLTSCSLHFEVTVPWYDKQTEPTSCSTSLEVYWCSILSLPVPFLPASHQWSPWPHSSNLWPHILLGHSTDEDLIFIEPHHLGFVSRLGTSMLKAVACCLSPEVTPSQGLAQQVSKALHA